MSRVIAHFPRHEVFAVHGVVQQSSAGDCLALLVNRSRSPDSCPRYESADEMVVLAPAYQPQATGTVGACL